MFDFSLVDVNFFHEFLENCTDPLTSQTQPSLHLALSEKKVHIRFLQDFMPGSSTKGFVMAMVSEYFTQILD